MRVSISTKVFLLFSTLTLITLGLGITSYYGYNAFSLSTGSVMALKDFSRHLERLNVMTAQISTDQSLSIDKEILCEIDRVKTRIDNILIIQDENRARQTRYKTMVGVGSVLALCFNLGMWLIISRYVNRFFKAQKSAIHAIASENYDYGFPAPSNDEIGDLSIGMKEIARNLSQARERYKDITDFKRLENQLIRAQKMAAIETLAGGIAHDFNNILFPIMGHTEMLLQDVPEDGDLYKRLKKIYTGAERAKDLVSRLLTFSRQDRGKVRYMDVGPVIDEALKLLRASLPATIEIHTQISPGCSKVMADPIQIHQIVMNLATNAFHAMEASGGVMTITLEQEIIDGASASAAMLVVPTGVYNLLTVADTGTGIADHVQEKIFDPYFTTKAQGKGTGMGLSVVHGIITRMGGSIDVATTPGKGSVFRVRIPAAD
ncbi:sensor histidine kinase [Desulfobacter vibrioformis]|uniref:sensor histidine kinase n=1 Tax=Desulfobacter vibrioformis TaxID=34031 RepID=UPI00068B4ACF|nr:ATP-binding protein [Desulfobacter vibrioformis]